jgi:hypothetical protein
MAISTLEHALASGAPDRDVRLRLWLELAAAFFQPDIDRIKRYLAGVTATAR